MAKERQEGGGRIAFVAIRVDARRYAFRHDVVFCKRCVSNDRNQAHVRDLPQRSRQVKAVPDRHLDVKNHNVRDPKANELEGRSGVSDPHPESLGFQHDLHGA